MHSSLTFAPDTFLTRDVAFTTSSDEICITCKFLDGANNASCYVSLTNNNHRYPFYLKIDHTLDHSSSTGCISGLPQGVYELKVFDIDNGTDTIPESIFCFKNVMITGSGEVLMKYDILSTHDI